MTPDLTWQGGHSSPDRVVSPHLTGGGGGGSPHLTGGQSPPDMGGQSSPGRVVSPHLTGGSVLTWQSGQSSPDRVVGWSVLT